MRTQKNESAASQAIVRTNFMIGNVEYCLGRPELLIDFFERIHNKTMLMPDDLYNQMKIISDSVVDGLDADEPGLNDFKSNMRILRELEFLFIELVRREENTKYI